MLHGLVGEETGVGVGEVFQLFCDGVADGGVVMPQAGNGGVAARVEVAFTCAVDDGCAFTAYGGGVGGVEAAVEDVGHDVSDW